MINLNMPLWFDWLDDEEWWNQLDEDEDRRSWIGREVDDIIASEDDDDDTGCIHPF